LATDEEKLRELLQISKENGATDAKIIDTNDIVIDKRVRLKCAIPLCSGYGTQLLCPPNLMPVDEFREIVKLYKKALIIQVEADVDSSDKSDQTLTDELCERLEPKLAEWREQLHYLVNKVETSAFKRGFYLAAGLIGGDCCLCEECVTPQSKEACRHPFESRPSMEAMGIDVHKTCQKIGLPLALSSKEKVRWTGLILLD